MQNSTSKRPTIPLFVRTSHHFDWGWTHADSSRKVGFAKLLKPRIVNSGNGHDDRGTSLLRVVVSKGTPQHLAREALLETLMPAYTDSCKHDYDCCGCRSATVQVKSVKGRTFSVRVNHYRNY